MNIYIQGHSYKKDIFELVRAFTNTKDINFLSENNKALKDEYVLTSIIQNNIVITKLYYNEKLLEHYIGKLENIQIPWYTNRQLVKLSIKKAIYIVLSKAFKVELPWGILTGIRPVKLIHKLLDMDLSVKDIIKILINEYKFDRSKAKLIVEVAQSQRKHIYPLDKNKFSLYINIPFCPSKCSYCSFPSFKIDKDKSIVDKYIDTLIHELDSSKEMFTGKRLNTVYIGGGTPTSLSTLQLEIILCKVKELFPQPIKEFTVEAGRPDTIDKEKLHLMRKYGVNRISINPQTFNLRTLKEIGRNHTLESIKSSYLLAKNLAFDIINMDIILGLPGEGLEELEITLEEIKKLNPNNLTVHTLSLKRGSRLHKGVLKESEDRTNLEKMLDLVSNFASNEGYLPYYLYRQKQILGNLENIGYAKLNDECIYNISMMEEKESVLAFGLGAVTKIYYPQTDKIQRIANFKSVFDYNERISELIKKKNSVSFT